MLKTLYWEEDALYLLDCRKLPQEEEYLICENYEQLSYAIEELVVRGAPAIGVAAAYGVVLGFNEAYAKQLDIEKRNALIVNSIHRLSRTRPTAVNLFWALDRMEKVFLDNKNENHYNLKKILLKEANKIYNEDIEINKNIGKYGKTLINKGDNILTHCNAGALATAGYGTALGVIRSAHDEGKNIHVYIDETRPLLQGSRLTAWELLKENIPATLIADNMAAYLMQLDKVDLVIFGADRIANNGDVANKIGSYSLAVLAKYHNIPLYVAAPTSTIDFDLNSGDEIPIEYRNKEELRTLYGKTTAPKTIDVFNPAFDVTPNKLIDGIITELGILKPPFTDSIIKLKNNLNIE